MKRYALIVFFVLADAALLFAIHTLSGGSLSVPALLADSLPVLLFALPGLIYSSAVCAVLSVLTGSFILLIHGIDIGSLLALKQPLTYPVFRLLAEHTEHASLAAQFGNLYYLAATILVLILLAVIAVFCMIAVRLAKSRKKEGNAPVLKLILCAVIAGSVLLPLKQPEYSVAGTMSELIREGNADLSRKSRPVRPGYFPGRVSQGSLEILLETGIVTLAPSERASQQKLPVFDRIVVVAAESLDLAYIHAYNPQIPANATPFLDRMAATYPSFTNFFTGSQPTSFGFSSMLLSRMDFDDDLRLECVSLCDCLRGKYRTRYIAPTNGDLFDNAPDYRALFRFDEQYFLNDLARLYGVRADTRWGLHDAAVLDCAVRLLTSAPAERSLTFISTMDLHNPYIGAKGPDSPFINALRTADANLEKFVLRLMADPQFFDEKTLIVLTADHSATHGENYTKRASFSPDRIPLILISKTPVQGLDTAKYFSQIDLAPALLGMLKIQVPQTFMGHDPQEKNSFALSFSSLDRTLRLNRPGQAETVVDLSQKQQDDSLKRALYEWYTAFYGPLQD